MQPALLDKVRMLRARAQSLALPLPIEVDGGVKPHNASICVDAGATVLVAGSAVFNGEQTPEQALAALRASLGGAQHP